VHAACRANIRASVNHLRHGSDIIENLVQNAGLMVVGAEYSLETGVVDFIENMPASREMSVIITRARASVSGLFENSTSPAPSLTFVRHPVLIPSLILWKFI
jgi:hypothetical protein